MIHEGLGAPTCELGLCSDLSPFEPSVQIKLMIIQHIWFFIAVFTRQIRNKLIILKDLISRFSKQTYTGPRPLDRGLYWTLQH